MCIVHSSNHCNVIVGVFVCSVYFILSVSRPPVSPLYLLVMSSPAEPLAMHRGAQGLQGAPVVKHCSRHYPGLTGRGVSAKVICGELSVEIVDNLLWGR